MKIPDYIKGHIENLHEICFISESLLGIATNIEKSKKLFKEGCKPLIMISGLSGSGKDTVMDLMIARDAKFKRVQTCTTRALREGENGLDDPHIRLTESEYLERLASGDVLEHAKYAGHYYCTSRSITRAAIEANTTPILRVDPVGAKNILNLWESGDAMFADVSIYYFFIIPDDFEVLRRRLLDRGSDEKTIADRMKQSSEDLKNIDKSQYIAINREGQAEKLVDEILWVVRNW